jgi:hypothetical protein
MAAVAGPRLLLRSWNLALAQQRPHPTEPSRRRSSRASTARPPTRSDAPSGRSLRTRPDSTPPANNSATPTPASPTSTTSPPAESQPDLRHLLDRFFPPFTAPTAGGEA